MSRKIYAVMMSFLLAAAVLPQNVYAEEGPASNIIEETAEETAEMQEAAKTYGDFEYTSDGSSVTITGYKGSGGEVVIPGKIGNCLSGRSGKTHLKRINR